MLQTRDRKVKVHEYMIEKVGFNLKFAHIHIRIKYTYTFVLSLNVN